MKTIHSIPHINVEAAGPSYSVPRLCQSLSEQGDEISLHCLQTAPSNWNFPIHTHPQWSFPAKLGVSPEMCRALNASAENANIMHNHSLWMMPNIYPARATRNNDCRLVTSPRGTLAPWARARSRWVKRAIWPMQKEALIRADCLHATAEIECQQIRDMGLSAPVAVIPNGVDMPELQPRIKRDGLKQLLFLGRIHPTKGVDLLLKVWSQLERVCPEWKLRIVGPDNGGYLQKMVHLRDELALERVSFSGPVYGEDKAKTYQESDLYILPTHTENFGITVAEALANSVPVIVTKGAPWQGLETNDCGWWVNRSERGLFDVLLQAMALSEKELQGMGGRGRVWMQRDFSWDEIGRKMHMTYEWLLGGGVTPEWVNED